MKHQTTNTTHQTTNTNIKHYTPSSNTTPNTDQTPTTTIKQQSPTPNTNNKHQTSTSTSHTKHQANTYDYNQTPTSNTTRQTPNKQPNTNKTPNKQTNTNQSNKQTPTANHQNKLQTPTSNTTHNQPPSKHQPSNIKHQANKHQHHQHHHQQQQQQQQQQTTNNNTIIKHTHTHTPTHYRSAYPMDQAKFLRCQVVFKRGTDHIRRFKLTKGDSAVRLYCKSCCSLIGTCSGTTPTISMPYDLFYYALTSNTKRHNVGNTGKEKADMKEICSEAKETDRISFREGSYLSCKFYCCVLLASLGCGCSCCAQGKGGLSSMLSNKDSIKEIVFKNKNTLTADDQLPPAFVPQPGKQERPGLKYKQTKLTNDNFGFAEA